ncbi:FxSxx-COOH system tetratricopeptide repeat protein [Saccharothrix coeruleofusca]|uniref:DUF7779 domain-containing protein n=1 Tax=Saccharothrix coeruleofusca TaxID=33919 RepID=A0A918EGS6_9PSEU|nr:FxSxx-COOH system tetratricopeptide repeat protein [Saccharothrix coeruleofusca]GGP84544.1 hypothetical protein GCM10010185_68010 [Saccharothrix coeruleofusca]
MTGAGRGASTGARAGAGERTPPTEAALGTRELTHRELRDALWLALRLRGAAPAAWSPPPLSPASADGSAAGPPEGGARSSSPPDPEDPPPASRAWEWSAVVGAEERAHDGGPGVAVPTALPALPARTRIARALRPLMRSAPSPWRQVLDEERTAERAAQDALWVPEWRPAAWHRFEVALVVDDSPSMAIWRHTAREFHDLLTRQGAFRDVRLHHADFSVDRPGQVVLRPENAEAKPVRWARLTDPTGRRLVLVLTDAVGGAWHSGAAEHVLHQWAQRMPVAVVHVLEQRLWHWGGLDARRVRLSAPAPWVANRRLRVSAVRPELGFSAVAGAPATPVPVLELPGTWTTAWARLVSAPGPEWVECTAALVRPFDGESAPEAEEEAAEEPAVEPTARERVLNFRTVASTAAFRLAGLLAAAPLDLPTMKLVQRALLPRSGLSVLAEVVLGGLLVRDRAADPAVAAYDFRPGVREELLAAARRSDTVRVARLVAEQAPPGATALRDFAAALDDPDSALPEDLRHVRVQAAVFRALSGPYLARAKRLAALLPGARQRGGGSSEGDVTDSGDPDRRPSVWGEVPLRNPDFTGREELLDLLRRRLAEGGTTAVLPEALHGMGGVGKSQTVVEYLYRHASDYELVWWVPAERQAQVKASFIDLAKRLGLPSTADAAVPAVLAALRDSKPYSRWVLVFDNADDPDDLLPFLPSGTGHVVITSRNPAWDEHAHPVEVDLFTRAESIELLHRRDRELADADADALAEALGDLPLAIEQAAAWRAQTGMAVAEYLRLLEQDRAQRSAAGASDDRLPIAAAWSVPLNRLAEEHPAALQLLRVCAFFGPEPISLELFRGIRDAPVPDALAEALRAPIKLDRATREITRYGLAKIDHRNNTLQLHRLVQAVVKDRLDAEERERMRHAVHMLLVNGDPNYPAVASTWPRYAALLPHAVMSEAIACTDSWTCALMINFVKYLLASGDYDGAIELSGQGVRAWRSIRGEDDLDTLEMSRLHASGLLRAGRVAEATGLNHTTYEKLRAQLGDDHETVISMMDTVAAGYRAEGRFADELGLQETVYAKACRVLGEDDPATLRYANNLAGCYRLMGLFSRARLLDQDTLDRRTTVLGADHLLTFRSLNGLAMDLRELGDYRAARSMQESTLRRQRELFGDDHPSTIGAVRNLAVARCRAGDHEGARTLAEDCLRRYRRKYGEQHLDSATALMTLSVVLRHLGDTPGAAELAERSHRLLVETQGEEHPTTLIAATNLAVAHRLSGDPHHAQELNAAATSALRRLFGSDHPFTLVASTNLASDLAALGDHAGALAADEDTLRRSSRVLGPEHPSALAVALNLAIDLRRTGERDESSRRHARVVESFRRVLGDAHPTTILAAGFVRANSDIDTMQL